MGTTPLNVLAKKIVAATGWVQHIKELNDALQPFIESHLSLDQIQAEHDAMLARKEALSREIMAREDHLTNVNERITLADDARKIQLDKDFKAYEGTIDTKRRQLEAELAKLAEQIESVLGTLMNKQTEAQALDEQIANQRRTLDQLKTDAAAVVSKLQAAAGGVSHEVAH